LVREFVQQLSGDEFVRPLLKVLEKVKFVGRRDFNDAVRLRLDERDDIDPASTVYSVLGDPDESSGAVSYLVKEVLSSRHIDVQRIDAAASASKDTLVLIDDFVGQGGRTLDVFESWLGKRPGKHPLSEASQEWLRAARVVLIFAAGMSSAEEEVPAKLEALGVHAEVYIHDKEIPNLYDVAHNIDKGVEVTELLKRVGLEVLQNSYGQVHARAAQNSLGFGNHGLLIAFPYSTPKQSVTAMWASGVLDHGQWQALFPRGDRTELES
jgi:hypothetical protein